ncbi:MAG: transposase [Cyclobacteriaceae bacterium]
MATKFDHSDQYDLYFCTFTCYKWLPLFELTNGYDAVYKWFDYLKKKEIRVVAFVIMPNHLHTILYFPKEGFDLNKSISNAKRFMAYEMVKRLKDMRKVDILQKLKAGLTSREMKKGQKHKVFEASFDAKPVYSEEFFYQKLDYIHSNPVEGKWKLANDFALYEHSSASFYELEKVSHFEPTHYSDI